MADYAGRNERISAPRDAAIEVRMTPKQYMVLGAGVGLVAAGLATFADLSIFAMVCFAAGALFGKGYGIWEERERPPHPASPERR